MNVAEGTLDARRRDLGRFAISVVTFERDTMLTWHHHPRACLAVVLAGDVRKTYEHGAYDAARASVIAMPAQSPHADRFGPAGAQIVVVELDDDDVDRAQVYADWGAAAVAHRIRSELACPDAFSGLALEGLALELIALAGRRPAVERRWVDEAAAILRARFRDPPSAFELAAEVGVHPAHLARCFRARHGESVGSFVRNLRLDWAADKVAQTETTLARVACEAGFADQSHFTRSFAQRFGITPGRYRVAHR